MGAEDPILLTPGAGVRLDVDLADLAPGILGEALNLQLNNPHGTARPRAGSRSLPQYNAPNLGGHPVSPLGNSDFDATAKVVALVNDHEHQRLYALVRTGETRSAEPVAVCDLYVCDYSVAGDGFDSTPVVTDIEIRADVKPQVLLAGGFLILATGTTTAHGNVFIDLRSAVARTLAGDIETTATPTTKPVTPTVNTATAGQLDAITGYLYRYLFYDPGTGARSRASDASTTTGVITSKVVKVTVTGADESGAGGGSGGWSKIEVYRTTDGGSVFRLLATLDNPGKASTLTFDDNVRDDQLDFRVLPRRRGRPPSCMFLAQHNDRVLYIGQTQGPVDLNAIYYSEPYTIGSVDPVANFVTARRGDGAVIGGVLRLVNRLFLIKSNGGIFELRSADPLSPYVIDALINNGPWACMAPNTIVDVGPLGLWLGPSGVVAFDGQTPRLISDPIDPDLVDRSRSSVEIVATRTFPPSSVSPSSFVAKASPTAGVQYSFTVRIYATGTTTPLIWTATTYQAGEPGETDGAYFEVKQAGNIEDYTAWSNLPTLSQRNDGVLAGNTNDIYVRLTPPPGVLTVGAGYDIWVDVRSYTPDTTPIAFDAETSAGGVSSGTDFPRYGLRIRVYENSFAGNPETTQGLLTLWTAQHSFNPPLMLLTFYEADGTTVKYQSYWHQLSGVWALNNNPANGFLSYGGGQYAGVRKLSFQLFTNNNIFQSNLTPGTTYKVFISVRRTKTTTEQATDYAWGNGTIAGAGTPISYVMPGSSTATAGAATVVNYIAGSVAPPAEVTRARVNISEAFAVHVPVFEEYWLFVASAATGRIDTCWVLDLRSLTSESGPAWRRHLIHATAAIGVDALAIEETGARSPRMVFGDDYGLIHAWPHGGVDRDAARETALTTTQRVGTGTVVSTSAVGFVLTADSAPDWPEPDTDEPGLLGQTVVLRDPATGETWTGVITDNTTDTLTVLWSLEDRIPTGDTTYDWAIGGIDARVGFHAFPAAAGGRVGVIRELNIQGVGVETLVRLETRSSDQPERFGPATRGHFRQRVLDAVPLGASMKRYPLPVRGRYLGLEVATIEADRAWTLAQVEVNQSPGGRR